LIELQGFDVLFGRLTVQQELLLKAKKRIEVKLVLMVAEATVVVILAVSAAAVIIAFGVAVVVVVVVVAMRAVEVVAVVAAAESFVTNAVGLRYPFVT
jgi:hypothetical protein